MEGSATLITNSGFPGGVKTPCPLQQKLTKNTISSSQAVRRPSVLLSLLIEKPSYSIGGTAGCVVASRLATADPDLRILVLEAGPETYNDPAHTLPTRFPSHLAPGSRTMRVHASRPSAALGGRSAYVHCGQCLGGGSSVNCTSSRLPLSPPRRFVFGCIIGTTRTQP